ncbi:MAG: hypothetical protein ACR2OO_09115 [Thermomicrobiales bacterium]
MLVHQSSERESSPLFSASIQTIVAHFCDGGCGAYGDLLEWCESRGDCSSAVACPSCGRRFVLDDEELEELQVWMRTTGPALACGVR